MMRAKWMKLKSMENLPLYFPFQRKPCCTNVPLMPLQTMFVGFYQCTTKYKVIKFVSKYNFQQVRALAVNGKLTLPDPKRPADVAKITILGTVHTTRWSRILLINSLWDRRSMKRGRMESLPSDPQRLSLEKSYVKKWFSKLVYSKIDHRLITWLMNHRHHSLVLTMLRLLHGFFSTSSSILGCAGR